MTFQMWYKQDAKNRDDGAEAAMQEQVWCVGNGNDLGKRVLMHV